MSAQFVKVILFRCGIFNSKETRLFERNANILSHPLFYISSCSCFYCIVNKSYDEKRKNCLRRLTAVEIQRIKGPTLDWLHWSTNRKDWLSFIGKTHNFLTSLSIESAYCVAVVFCRVSWVACRCLESLVSPVFRAVSVVAFTPWKASPIVRQKLYGFNRRRNHNHSVRTVLVKTTPNDSRIGMSNIKGTPYRTFLVRFGGISDEFGRAMVRNLAKIPMARPNEPDLLPKRTKRGTIRYLPYPTSSC